MIATIKESNLKQEIYDGMEAFFLTIFGQLLTFGWSQTNIKNTFFTILKALSTTSISIYNELTLNKDR